jgi:hypothetical protein
MKPGPPPRRSEPSRRPSEPCRTLDGSGLPRTTRTRTHAATSASQDSASTSPEDRNRLLYLEFRARTPSADLAVVLGPERRAQLPLQDFPGTRLRQRLGLHIDPLRNLVAGDAVATERNQLRDIELLR